jgi:hypothetical protein
MVAFNTHNQKYAKMISGAFLGYATENMGYRSQSKPRSHHVMPTSSHFKEGSSRDG